MSKKYNTTTQSLCQHLSTVIDCFNSLGRDCWRWEIKQTQFVYKQYGKLLEVGNKTNVVCIQTIWETVEGGKRQAERLMKGEDRKLR